MLRLRRLGLSLTFAVTLAGGVLASQPAQATTVPPGFCAKLDAYEAYLTDLAKKYPNNDRLQRAIAYLLQQVEVIEARYCGAT